MQNGLKPISLSIDAQIHFCPFGGCDIDSEEQEKSPNAVATEQRPT
jgi:hypothetical protein